MQAILNIRMLSVRVALLALLAAGVVLQSAQAQSANQNQKSDNKVSGSSQAQPPSESSKATEKESAPANKEHAGGRQEGIKVHGHWVIDVRNPDGTLATHREFENAYAGERFLSSILSRQSSVGLWRIYLLDGDQISLVEPNDPYDQASSKNLTLSTRTGAFVLNGSVTVPRAGIIGFVQTAAMSCDPNTAPVAPCLSGNSELFTSTELFPNVISVVTGQTVLVTVAISFS